MQFCEAVGSFEMVLDEELLAASLNFSGPWLLLPSLSLDQRLSEDVRLGKPLSIELNE